MNEQMQRHGLIIYLFDCIDSWNNFSPTDAAIHERALCDSYPVEHKIMHETTQRNLTSFQGNLLVLDKNATQTPTNIYH